MINTEIEVKEKVLEIGGKRSAVPVHKQNYHVPVLEHIFNSGNNIYITPKVDGILTNFEYCGMLFECEKLDGNMFLIDVINSVKYQSLYTRFKMLESIFKTQILHPIKSKAEVRDVLNQYDSTFVEHENCVLVIKPIFYINKKNIDKNKNMFDLMGYVMYGSTQYNTDGWIIYTDNLQTLKWKPVIYMTIDVEYHQEQTAFTSSDRFVLNNIEFDKNIDHVDGVYRCYYSDTEKKWLAREKRNDKIRGNKLGTVVTLHAYRARYDQSEKTFDTNLKPYYFDNNNDNKYNKKTESHGIRNICMADIQNKIGIQSNSILDIGCGNGALYYNFIKQGRDIFYIGIDIDPFMLSKTPLGGCYLWQDINNLDTQYILHHTQIAQQSGVFTFDVATFIHSLHFCKDLPKLFNEISKLTDRVIIVGIFEDYFPGDFEMADVKVKKQENGLYDFYYKWKDHKITDKLLKNSDFEGLIGWEITYQYQYNHPSNPFINMHQMIVLNKT